MRSKRAPKRIVQPDLLFNSRLLAKLINRVMKDGKKSLAQRLVYKALEQVKIKTGEDPVKVLEKATLNITPKMEVRPRRVGGASYQVPVEVKGGRGEALAIRWLIMASSARANKEYHSFDQKLSTEIVDAYKGMGGAVKKKEDMEKQAAANRAFAHFRW